MTEEDEEFNRIERESMMRMKAVEAVVTRGGSRATVEMAREAAGDDWGLFREYMPEIHRLAELVRADERARMAEQPAEQEPVAWIWKYANGEEEVVFVPPRHVDATHVDAPSTITPLYTSPPAQRTWVGLTDEDIEQGCKESWVTEEAWQSAVWWAETKLRERNT